MIALIKALESYFAANTPLKAAFPGYNNANSVAACVTNFWQDMVPENAPLPSCVYSIVDSGAQPLYPSTNNYAPSNTTVRFTAYALGKNAAMAAGETITAQMDVAVLTLASGTISNLFRRGDAVPYWESKSVGSLDVWACSVVYEIAVDPLPI